MVVVVLALASPLAPAHKRVLVNRLFVVWSVTTNKLVVAVVVVDGVEREKAAILVAVKAAMANVQKTAFVMDGMIVVASVVFFFVCLYGTVVPPRRFRRRCRGGSTNG